MLAETIWKVFPAMKKIAFALIALAAIFGFSSAASAAPGDYPPDPPKVTVDNPSTTPGGTVVLGVTGCDANAPITVTGGGTSTTTTAGADGSATISVTAPSTPGTYPVTVTCGGTSTTVNINVVTLPAGTNGGSTPTGGLPATGSDGTSTTMMLGLGALIIGGGLFGVSQIRRRQTLSA